MSAEQQSLQRGVVMACGPTGPVLAASPLSEGASYRLSLESNGIVRVAAALDVTRAELRTFANDLLTMIGAPSAVPPSSDLSNSGIGERIVAARRRAGLTQKQLADCVGVSRSAVAQWETGRSGQARRNLSAVAAALAIDVITLLQQ